MSSITLGAHRALARSAFLLPDRVTSVGHLRASGVTWDQTRAQLAAHRWQLLGRAVVTHGGPLTREERWYVAIANCGRRAVLTSFTAAEAAGLEGWRRNDIHVLVPGGARIHPVAGITIRSHHVGDWATVDRHPLRPVHRIAPALIRAASSFGSPRSGCGILAAGVQQRLLTTDMLLSALEHAPRVRHRAQLLLAVYDIEQGARALSEIDFVRLCRRQRIPVPEQQYVRRDRHGRRRYLDAVWRRQDGRLVVAEVDGALHLAQRSWWKDQFRQNEIAIDADALVVRYPSVIVRTEEAVVADQLQRSLLPRSWCTDRAITLNLHQDRQAG